MKQFDLISDTHIDKWLRFKNDNEYMSEFVDSLLPDEISEVLVIAGDLGHNNQQNVAFLTLLKNYYKYILLVPGNHDYYLVDGKTRYKYAKSSLNRHTNMKKLASELEGVHYLEGDIINIDGVNFGGVGMWYDFSYGVQRLNKSLTEMFGHWNSGMNDEKYIFGVVRKPIDWFWHEKEKLNKIVDDSDVIITHICPDWSKVPMEYELDPLTGCFYFDGSEYFDRIYGKIWCFGHTHRHYSYMKQGCWFVNNALGHPKEDMTGTNKIVNIPLEATY